MFVHIILLSVAVVILGSAAGADVQVTDGDTLEIDGTTYRLEGIDAPEFGQTCRARSGPDWPCGKRALETMVALTQGKSLTCDPGEPDQYGRTLGKCYADGVDVGEEMVRRGFAWAFVRYSDTYIDVEAQAREERVGIWQSLTMPAWEFRAQRWEAAEAAAPDGCPIKGNISESGKIYHPPWSPWYARTKINLAKGERWFCSEGEALEAGWRAPRWR